MVSGNLTGTNLSYLYNAENQLVSVQNGGTTTASYTYDGDGNLVVMTGSASTKTVRIGNHYEELFSNGTVTERRSYYFLGGARVAMRLNTTVSYFHTDHLGSISAATNSSGSLLYASLYKPWGESRYQSAAPNTDYQFTGQRRDSYINLYLMGSRWYAPVLGRFISPDSIIPQPGNPITWDRYSYVYNNSINYNDPTGHFACGDGVEDPRCDQFDPPSIPNTVSPQPSSPPPSTGNNWDLINSNPYYLLYWPYLMFPQEGPCLGNLGCWGGIDYAHFAVQVNSPYFDKITQGYLSDLAFLWGFNGSTSVPGIYHTGGLEEIAILRDGTRATYQYGGQGSAVGAGANATAYGGLAVNVKTPDDYRGISASAGLTVSILDVGITVSYFWNGDYAPLTPGVVQGFQIGYSPGAHISAWWSNVVYSMNWSSK
jgi:RHS repeat-associated protein